MSNIKKVPNGTVPFGRIFEMVEKVFERVSWDEISKDTRAWLVEKKVVNSSWDNKNFFENRKVVEH